jgi:deoxyadenosine/deoxycytidine kinase
MSNNRPRLLIVEGAQGVGKTTITRMLREKMPYTVLMSLTGVEDISETGKIKVFREHNTILDTIKHCANCDINFILDRSFITEDVYCLLGYKEYSFDYEYIDLLLKLSMLISSYDTKLVLLLASKEEFEKRLKRNKAQYSKVNFSVEHSVEQQTMYLKSFGAIQNVYPKIKMEGLITDNVTPEKICEQIMK